MRFSPILILAFVTLLLAAAGCTTAPQSGPLTTPAETPDQPATTTTVAKCPAGQTACTDGSCRDTTSDHDACGGCGNVCPAGFICKASGCVNPAGATAVTKTTAPATAVQTTVVPANPVTSAVTTGIPTITAARKVTTAVAGRGSASFSEGVITFAETTSPNTSFVVDCKKYPISITSVYPLSGAAGTQVLIHGSGFKNKDYKDMQIFFGKYARGVYLEGQASDTELITIIAEGMDKGAVPVQVVVGFGPGVLNSCSSEVTSKSEFYIK